jgi:hypothetical protein
MGHSFYDLSKLLLLFSRIYSRPVMGLTGSAQPKVDN